MVLKIYLSGISGNKEVKKKQQRVQMILDSKSISYEAIDITEPGREKDKETMQLKAKTREVLGKHPLPPQIFNEEEYCGDYEDFDMANEVDELEAFLHLPIPSKLISSDNDTTDKLNGSREETDAVRNGSKVSKVNGDVELTSIVSEADTPLPQTEAPVDEEPTEAEEGSGEVVNVSAESPESPEVPQNEDDDNDNDREESPEAVAEEEESPSAEPVEVESDTQENTGEDLPQAEITIEDETPERIETKDVFGGDSADVKGMMPLTKNENNNIILDVKEGDSLKESATQDIAKPMQEENVPTLVSVPLDRSKEASNKQLYSSQDDEESNITLFDVSEVHVVDEKSGLTTSGPAQNVVVFPAVCDEKREESSSIVEKSKVLDVGTAVEKQEVGLRQSYDEDFQNVQNICSIISYTEKQAAKPDSDLPGLQTSGDNSRTRVKELVTEVNPGAVSSDNQDSNAVQTDLAPRVVEKHGVIEKSADKLAETLEISIEESNNVKHSNRPAVSEQLGEVNVSVDSCDSVISAVNKRTDQSNTAVVSVVQKQSAEGKLVENPTELSEDSSKIEPITKNTSEVKKDVSDLKTVSSQNEQLSCDIQLMDKVKSQPDGNKFSPVCLKREEQAIHESKQNSGEKTSAAENVKTELETISNVVSEDVSTLQHEEVDKEGNNLQGTDLQGKRADAIQEIIKNPAVLSVENKNTEKIPEKQCEVPTFSLEVTNKTVKEGKSVESEDEETSLDEFKPLMRRDTLKNIKKPSLSDIRPSLRKENIHEHEIIPVETKSANVTPSNLKGNSYPIPNNEDSEEEKSIVKQEIEQKPLTVDYQNLAKEKEGDLENINLASEENSNRMENENLGKSIKAIAKENIVKTAGKSTSDAIKTIDPDSTVTGTHETSEPSQHHKGVPMRELMTDSHQLFSVDKIAITPRLISKISSVANEKKEEVGVALKNWNETPKEIDAVKQVRRLLDERDAEIAYSRARMRAGRSPLPDPHHHFISQMNKLVHDLDDGEEHVEWPVVPPPPPPKLPSPEPPVNEFIQEVLRALNGPYIPKPKPEPEKPKESFIKQVKNLMNTEELPGDSQTLFFTKERSQLEDPEFVAKVRVILNDQEASFGIERPAPDEKHDHSIFLNDFLVLLNDEPMTEEQSQVKNAPELDPYESDEEENDNFVEEKPLIEKYEEIIEPKVEKIVEAPKEKQNPVNIIEPKAEKIAEPLKREETPAEIIEVQVEKIAPVKDEPKPVDIIEPKVERISPGKDEPKPVVIIEPKVEKIAPAKDEPRSVDIIEPKVEKTAPVKVEPKPIIVKPSPKEIEVAQIFIQDNIIPVVATVTGENFKIFVSSFGSQKEELKSHDLEAVTITVIEDDGSKSDVAKIVVSPSL